MTKILKLEKIRERFEQGENPTELLNELERTFGIPVINDPSFNEKNPEVLKLYHEISNARGL